MTAGSLVVVDITDRFAELVRGPDGECRLDVAAMLIAAHARRDLDLDHEVARLDAIAGGCPDGTLAGITGHLFDDLGFAGDTDDYGDPRNSLLDVVLDRRKGIPITLSVVLIEVARRRGLDLVGVGLPGHFLARDGADDDLFVDPFHQQMLDRAGVAKLFESVHGPRARFEARFLDPVDNRAIVTRMVTNLQRSYAARGDRAGALWAQCLRVLVPGTTVQDRRQLAAMLAANGRFDAAADELEAVATEGGGARDRHAARALRAKLN